MQQSIDLPDGTLNLAQTQNALNELSAPNGSLRDTLVLPRHTHAHTHNPLHCLLHYHYSSIFDNCFILVRFVGDLQPTLGARRPIHALILCILKETEYLSYFECLLHITPVIIVFLACL